MIAQYRRYADMEFLKTYAKEIIALLVPFLAWFLNTRLKARAKLAWSNPHSFTFLVQEPLRDPQGNIIRPNQTVSTAQVRVTNVGRDTATHVELVFNFKALFVNLWPVRHYVETIEPDGRHILIFDSLAPSEEIGLEIMSINAELPALLVVRSDQCVAQNVKMVNSPFVQPWVIKLAQFLLVMGIAAVIYITIAILQFLVLKTPPVF